MTIPRQSRRAGRSNPYSRSKCTHWAPFDPYEGECATIPPDLPPAALFPLTATAGVPIYERPVQPAFLRPVEVGEVLAVLATVPLEFLQELRGIYLLGGTRKQDQVALGDLYRYGAYRWGMIYLHAFPRRRLRRACRRLPKPDVRRDYERAGAVFTADGDGWVCQFAEGSLKRFYLHDVLIHEIGHHVDRSRRGPSRVRAERFASWFARHYGPSGALAPPTGTRRPGRTPD